LKEGIAARSRKSREASTVAQRKRDSAQHQDGLFKSGNNGFCPSCDLIQDSQACTSHANVTRIEQILALSKQYRVLFVKLPSE
jgi:hypothetical protein